MSWRLNFTLIRIRGEQRQQTFLATHLKKTMGMRSQKVQYAIAMINLVSTSDIRLSHDDQ